MHNTMSMETTDISGEHTGVDVTYSCAEAKKLLRTARAPKKVLAALLPLGRFDLNVPTDPIEVDAILPSKHHVCKPRTTKEVNSSGE